MSRLPRISLIALLASAVGALVIALALQPAQASGADRTNTHADHPAPAVQQRTVAPEPGCGTMKQCIANLARYELSNDDHHKYEHPDGSNCNFFSTRWHDPGAAHCSNGMWAESWCMDFVHWIYKQEHASVAGLGVNPHLAASARNYGNYHHTWHPHVPHVGDMALWNTNHHVEIVVRVNRSTHYVTTISGNWSDQISRKHERWSSYLGFASPVHR